MNCRTARKKFEASLVSGRAVLPEAVESHLRTCNACQREHAILTRTLGLLRSEDPWSPTEGFFDRLTHQALREKERAATRAEADSFANRLRWSLGWLWVPRSWSWGWATAVVMMCFVAAGGWWGIQDITTRTGKVDYVAGTVRSARGSSSWSLAADGQATRKGSSFRTATDGEAIMTLSDKSEIYLASFSAMSLPGHRAAVLQSGMAWFEVARGEVQFTVEIPAYGSVRVLGTSFGIIIDTNNGECSVTVGAGRVVVENAGGRQALSSGEEAAITLGGNPVKRRPRQLARMLAFRDRLIRNRNEYELKKYYPSLAPPSQPAGRR